MYNPWQSFTGSPGRHMTGVDIGGRGESWPLTGGGVWDPVRGITETRRRRLATGSSFLTVVPFYFSWEKKLHTIRNYRGLLFSSVVMATQINRWRQVSSFTVFCRPERLTNIWKEDHYHKIGFLIYCFLLCYRGSCFHKYIMNYANRHGPCKWLGTTNRNCRINLKSGIKVFRSGFGRHSHFPVIKDKPPSSCCSHIWFVRSAVLGCRTSPSPLPTPNFLSSSLLSPLSSPPLIPPPPYSAVIASVCHLYNPMNVCSSVFNSVLMDVIRGGFISKA